MKGFVLSTLPFNRLLLISTQVSSGCLPTPHAMSQDKAKKFWTASALQTDLWHAKSHCSSDIIDLIKGTTITKYTHAREGHKADFLFTYIEDTNSIGELDSVLWRAVAHLLQERVQPTIIEGWVYGHTYHLSSWAWLSILPFGSRVSRLTLKAGASVKACAESPGNSEPFPLHQHWFLYVD